MVKKVITEDEEDSEDEEEQDEEETEEEESGISEKYKEVLKNPKKVSSKNLEVALVETIKEKGIGLRLPDGSLIELSNLDVGLVRWMEWATKNISDIKRSIAGA